MPDCRLCGQPIDAEPGDFEGFKIGPTVHDECLEKENREFYEKTRPKKTKAAAMKDINLDELDLAALLKKTRKIVRMPYADDK